MKIQLLSQLINAGLVAQPPASSQPGNDCVETIYIETRSVNGKIQERVIRHSGGFCLPSTEHGIKIMDGLFLKNHMTNDGRTDLVQKYNDHRKAIIIVAQNGDLSSADLITLVNDFNRIWAEQTTSVAKMDTGNFEERLCNYLKPMIKSIYEAAIKKIPDIIAAAISAAKSSDWSSRGLDYYMDKAKSADYSDKGLDYYLDKAKSAEWNDKGLDYYLDKAKSAEWNDKGLDYYLDRAKSNEWNQKGLGYWKRTGKSSEWNKKGYGYLKKFEERCRLAHWNEVKSAYENFESAIQKKHDTFVKNIRAKHGSFETKMKGDHQTFKTAVTAAHSGFVKTANGLYNTFVKEANKTKEPTIQELKRLEAQSVEAANGQSSLQAIMKKIDGAPATLRVLRRGLKEGVQRVGTRLEKEHRALSATFEDKYSALQDQMETQHEQLSTDMERLYNTLGKDFESAYDTMRVVFDEFLRKYD